MENTYWNHNGRYQVLADQLQERVPDEGASDNPKIEALRVAGNVYYDLYNNGMCNWEIKKEEFETLLSVELSKKGQKALLAILSILPSDGDTEGCPDCDGYGQILEENEVDYIVDGELEYEIEEYYVHCYQCNGEGYADWKVTWGYVDDSEHDKLAPLFETLMDSVIQFIVTE